VRDGHCYGDKAPGAVALALPAFAAAAGKLRLASLELDSPTGWRVSSLCILSTLPAGIPTNVGIPKCDWSAESVG
jgi:hypothetical protein